MKSLDDVLSEVGGVLGFWFGGSIITFIGEEHNS